MSATTTLTSENGSPSSFQYLPRAHASQALQLRCCLPVVQQSPAGSSSLAPCSYRCSPQAVNLSGRHDLSDHPPPNVKGLEPVWVSYLGHSQSLPILQVRALILDTTTAQSVRRRSAAKQPLQRQD